MAKKEVSEAAEKVAQAEKAAKKAEKKTNPNGNFFKRAGKAIKKYCKDLKGEVKKIVWPDGKTVLKSTAVVLMVVIIVGAVIFGIDWLLTKGVELLKTLAQHLAEKNAAADTTTADTAANVVADTAAFMNLGKFFLH